MNYSSFFPNGSSHRAIATLTTASIALLVTGCTNLLTNDYEATAVATYVWQVEYSGQTDRPLDRRIERFETTSLTNVDGIQPNGAVTGPDDKGLWWPDLPPRPTVDDLEANLSGGRHHVVLTSHADVLQISQLYGCNAPNVGTFSSYRFGNGEVRAMARTPDSLPDPSPLRAPMRGTQAPA